MWGCVTARVAWADPWALATGVVREAESGPVQSVPGRAPTRAIRLHDGARVEPLCGITLALKDLRLDSGMVWEGGLWTCPGSCRGPPHRA